jgi:hypothetical protein
MHANAYRYQRIRPDGSLRAGWGNDDLEFVHVNEVAGGPAAAAHLLTFDSVHVRWNRRVEFRRKCPDDRRSGGFVLVGIEPG